MPHLFNILPSYLSIVVNDILWVPRKFICIIPRDSVGSDGAIFEFFGTGRRKRRVQEALKDLRRRG